VTSSSLAAHGFNLPRLSKGNMEEKEIHDGRNDVLGESNRVYGGCEAAKSSHWLT